MLLLHGDCNDVFWDQLKEKILIVDSLRVFYLKHLQNCENKINLRNKR
jgi:hypothetical protein